MSRWYRSHVGLVTDAKLGEIALVVECSRAVAIAAWHAILESCASVNDGGRYDTTARRVAAILGEPVAKVEAVFTAFADLGMIAEGRVTAWTRRQFESDSSTERSRKHREAKRSGELTRAHAVEPSPDETTVQRCATPPYSYSEPEVLTLTLPSEAAREVSRQLPAKPFHVGTVSANGGPLSARGATKPVQVAHVSADRIEPDGFERFWQAMPSPNPATKAAALATFARLCPEDQAAAIAGAARYAAAFAAKPTTHPISPVRFLRERCFEGYGPPAQSGEATCFVRVDTPQWRAWSAYRGKPIPLNREGTGWHFPSEWPPNRERGAA